MRRSSFGPRGALFRRQVKRRRIEANLKQQDVAARLDRPQSFVAKYENGERRLDVVEFIEVAEAIGFDPADFIRDFRSSAADTCDSVTSLEEAGESAYVETPRPAPVAPERWRVKARAGGVFAINVDRGDGTGFRPPPPDEVEAALRRLSDLSLDVRVPSAATPSGESTNAAEADTLDAGVPSRTGLSHKPASGVPTSTLHNDGTEEPEVYRDKAGRRRRRRLASPEARRTRNAKARELHALGMSIREIAHELGCGHGTVERALKER